MDLAEADIRKAGYAGFSFRDLAAEIGIKSASVHYHFPTKATMAAAVARRYGDRFLAAVARRPNESAGDAHLRLPIGLQGGSQSPWADVRNCAGFWTPAITRLYARSADRRPKSAKARSRGGSWAPAGQRALWGFDVSADLDGGRNTARKRPGCVDRRGGDLQWASRQALGAHRRALGALIGVIGSREITAGVEPSHRNGKVATLTIGLSHYVSTLLGIGRHLGSQPH